MAEESSHTTPSVAAEETGIHTAVPAESGSVAGATVTEGAPPEEPSVQPTAKKEDSSTAVTTDADADAVATTTATISKEAVAAVAERLQFFFSDANVRQDFFIRKFLIKTDGEYAGQVKIDTLLKFNTIKQHTTDPQVVIQAAQSLPDQLVLSSDQKAIGRVKPFTTEMMADNIPRALVVSNLPLSTGTAEGASSSADDSKEIKYLVTTEEIRDLFLSYGPVAMVKLHFKTLDQDDESGEQNDHGDDDEAEPQKKSPYNTRKRRGGQTPKKRVPLGSAMVEFETAEAQQKAADDVLTSKDGQAVEPKRKLSLQGQDLQIMSLQEHLDSRKNTKRKSPDEDGKETDAPAVEPYTFDWKPGCVIRLEGVSKNCDREAIMEAVALAMDTTMEELKEERNNAKSVYVDYSRGQKDGAIRFAEPSETVAAVCQKLSSGELKVAGSAVEAARVLQGEEEEKYWKEFIEFKNKQREHKADEKSHHHKNHHHHHHHHHHHNNKRSSRGNYRKKQRRG